MSDKEKDPPLADKPKLSSLTDFEIKALKLQKEGKLEELNQEIENISGPQKQEEEKAPEADKAAASSEDMRLYNNILQKVRNPVSLDKVPPRLRKEIEEGIAILNDLVSDKEKFKRYKDIYDAAVKKSNVQANPLKPPVLPDDLKVDPKVELKNKPSGDVSTEPAKVDEKPSEPEKPRSSQSTEEKISFINDINTEAAGAYKPSRPQYTEEQTMDYKEYEKEPQRATLDLITNCQHCGWDLKRKDLVQVTDLDKYDFVQSILGGIKFKKEYLLFDGKYKLTFRALTSKESDLAYRQIVIDGQTDFQSRVMGGTDFYWRNLQAYRMVMSLESIESVQYGRIELPTIEEAEIEFEGKTLQSKLIPFLHHVLDNHLPMESMRVVVGHAHYEFQALCDKLQVMAESPTFWKAIA